MSAPIRRTLAHIDLDALRHNFRLLQASVGPEVVVLAPVKGMAYGHGAVPCARALEEAGCTAFGVALVEEGRALREAGIQGRILCLGGIGRAGAQEAVASRLTPMVYDLETACALDRAARESGEILGVHLKVDTGMGRLGVPLSEWRNFLAEFTTLSALRVEGIATHFSDADLVDSDFSIRQAEGFEEAVGQARKAGMEPMLLHAANSAATLAYPEFRYSMVRTGLALYGVLPRADLALDLRPVMRVTTEVLFVKTLEAGEGVSYGRTWKSGDATVIATLPVGYADGYPRSLSNRAEVEIRGHRCPIRGSVCMDLLMVDVSGVPGGVSQGDEAILLGGSITAAELAKKADTIPYDILCSFSERVPRSFLGVGSS